MDQRVMNTSRSPELSKGRTDPDGGVSDHVVHGLRCSSSVTNPCTGAAHPALRATTVALTAAA